MVFLQSMVSALNFLRCRLDEDVVDRLCSFYTSSMLIMMAMLVSFKQFGGSPLECWVPAHFSSSWEAYTEMYCWSQNTYYVAVRGDVPSDNSQRLSKRISYYQWVPFFLLIEAFLFYCPCLFWRALNGMTGLKIDELVSAINDRTTAVSPEIEEQTTVYVARHLEHALRYQHANMSSRAKSVPRLFHSFTLRYYETYVTSLYIAIKVICILNIFVNLVLMNTFLETDDYTVYGLGVIIDLMGRRGWEESGNFPRVTLCDYTVRVLGHVQQQTVQCVLVINIFTEKIFILLWFWYSILCMLGISSLFYWLTVSAHESARIKYVYKHLQLEQSLDLQHCNRCNLIDKQMVTEFVRGLMKMDGVFVLRMVSLHCGAMMCSELTQALWKIFIQSHPKPFPERKFACTCVPTKDIETLSNSDCNSDRLSIASSNAIPLTQFRSNQDHKLHNNVAVQTAGQSKKKLNVHWAHGKLKRVKSLSSDQLLHEFSRNL